jgi:SpoVK/Ycf46/Vps4 family AAA+-type ATPase
VNPIFRTYSIDDEDEDYDYRYDDKPPKLFTKRKPKISLDDVVLTEKNRRLLNQALVEYKYRDMIVKKWKFSEIYSRSKGTTLLFVGPPGTGKTMTAEAVAHALGKQLYVVRMDQLISKWWGDSAKHVQKLFEIAEREKPVLFIDEADAILYGRDEDGMSHRFEEVSAFLTHIERYRGFTILATNLSYVLDKALERRVDIVIHFDIPDAKMREEIYRKIIPPKAPIADDVDLSRLAKRYPLAGGGILNVVRSAIRHALERYERDGNEINITMADFEIAAKNELDKGQVINRDYLMTWDGERNVDCKGALAGYR